MASRNIPSVYLVDDDARVRRALKWLIESIGQRALDYASAEQFLEAYRPGSPGCLVLDIRMAGMSGLQLLEELRSRGIRLPAIILTGHGNVRAAVRAMKLGAVDFMEKPHTDQELLELVQKALREDAHLRTLEAERSRTAVRLQTLTHREHQILERIVRGHANKVIALELGISEKTVEVHRKKIMQKMQAKSFADLVKMTVSKLGD